MELIGVFKALSDENRLRILNLLSIQKLCVCELETLLQIKQSNLSRHLNKLKVEKIIKGEKDSQWVHYYINKKFALDNKILYEWILLKIQNEEKCLQDSKRLKKYNFNELSCDDIRKDLEKVLRIIAN